MLTNTGIISLLISHGLAVGIVSLWIINKKLICLLEIFKKYGYNVIQTMNKNIYHIYNPENIIIGTMLKNTKVIKIMFNNSPISFNIGKNSDITESIIVLENILNTRLRK